MKKYFGFVLMLFSANAAFAQDPALSFTIGARAWQTDWTTFSYYVDPDTGDQLALTQVSADSELVLMPLVSVRYRDFFGSLSGFPSKDFDFDDDTRGSREEFDANVGYYLIPGLAVTLGYKKVEQSGDSGRYRPAGPVLGVSANAPLSGAWSLYGNLGLGKLKTPGGDDIHFKADYRLAELGLAYTLNGANLPKHWTFTAGYRIQVLKSKDAFGDDPSQDGRDTTQGFTVGVLASF